MNKTIKSFLFLIILTINSLIKPFEFKNFFDPEDVKRQAALNIKLREEAKKAAKQKIAENEEWERRQKIFTAVINGGVYIAFNTLKFGYKLITNTNKTIERLKKGNPNVVTGFIGLTLTSLLGIIYYNNHKEQQKENARKNEKARKKNEADEENRRKKINEEKDRSRKEREDDIEAQRKYEEDTERALKESLTDTDTTNSSTTTPPPSYNPYYFNNDGTLKQNLYPNLSGYNNKDD